ncbi:hypothetical protein Syn7803C16_79 [Synechococcus phage ACG-2014f]|uniref:Uncharacterized protein n=1 Tax=Synechococcus phage ACG-2014f TaxID=1493511 RepID=A0A0E3I5F1_9CAUD|nr:hypothetical protein Syn7803C16_79 [Synechococcus phage ACG-2014f]AIX43719.1 hypothetical protein Syn7803C24_80 [Synechococcus phage ACG-2014f]
MAEVQLHGNIYEETVIRDITGLDKSAYDKTKKNGYTSVWDIEKGEYSDNNISIKTTGSNTVCMGDAVRMASHTSYNLVVGVYDQRGNTKVFTTEYTFYITDADTKKIWGTMEVGEVTAFVDFVKSIPHGKEGQTSTKEYRNEFLSQIQDKSALMVINPKVDSKKQRRVQCSMRLSQLLESGVKYTKKDMNLQVSSSRRKFN